MYSRILVATDGSEASQRAAEHAVRLAKSIGARAIIATVTGPLPDVMLPQVADRLPAILAQVAKAAEGHLAAAREIALRHGVECETLHVTDRTALQGIIETANARGCDLIVMGSHGSGALKSLLLGSTTLKVLAAVSIPVLVCR